MTGKRTITIEFDNDDEGTADLALVEDFLTAERFTYTVSTQ